MSTIIDAIIGGTPPSHPPPRYDSHSGYYPEVEYLALAGYSE